jgi:hypothetical protein
MHDTMFADTRTYATHCELILKRQTLPIAVPVMCQCLEL